MSMVQLAILMIFASVGFGGTFALFLIWVLSLCSRCSPPGS